MSSALKEKPVDREAEKQQILKLIKQKYNGLLSMHQWVVDTKKGKQSG
jgi:hypothetical protein